MLELPVLRSKNSALSGVFKRGWVRAASSQCPCCPDSIPLRGCEQRSTARPRHLLSKWREKMPVGKATSRPAWFWLWHLGSRCAPGDCLPAAGAVGCYRCWNSTGRGVSESSPFICVLQTPPIPDKVCVMENRAVYQVSGVTRQPGSWVFTNIPQQQVVYGEGMLTYMFV